MLSPRLKKYALRAALVALVGPPLIVALLAVGIYTYAQLGRGVQLVTGYNMATGQWDRGPASEAKRK